MVPVVRGCRSSYLHLKQRIRYLLLQYLDVARALEGYGTEVFPHCACDARKSGHVIVSISIESFRLQACSDQGERQVNTSCFHLDTANLK